MGKLNTTDETDIETVRTVVQDARHNVILVVRLESSNPLRKRYLVIVSAPLSNTGSAHKEKVAHTVSSPGSPGRSADLDYCLLGVDSIYTREDGGEESLVSVSIGFVLKMLWGTKVSLDGDGGFSVRQLAKHFVIKPNSVQALWTVIQTLHLITSKLKPKRNSLCLVDSDWVRNYERSINSPQSCINEWNSMPDILVRRAPSPDQLSRLTGDQVDQETKKSLIKSKLRQIMKTVDLDTITSKVIRVTLEEELNQKLDEFKAFIDEEILLILGQMDPASKVFDFLYLGSEWNASNLEELNCNGVTHILNVTREIDNFFPSVFQYLNIREYDVEETDLLKYWDKTYLFIKDCLGQGGRVLVHCKMGISRSASTVIAFAMKYFNWTLAESLEHVKNTRSIIDPNSGFRQQLQVYEGILEASKKRITFRKQRSKSESNVPCERPGTANHNRTGTKAGTTNEDGHMTTKRGGGTDKVWSSNRSKWRSRDNQLAVPDTSNQDSNCDTSGQLNSVRARPKSWSPADSSFSDALDPNTSDETDPIICHCYTQLAQYFNNSNAFPSNIGSRTYKSLVTKDPPGLVEARNLKVRLVEPEPEAEPEAESGAGDGSAPCPARSHIDQCTCHLEIELKVCDGPVDMTEISAETEQMLKNIGNFPIHIRHAAGADHFKENHPGYIGLDTSGAEELSVKTLADMFDFKLGEEPSKPPLTSRHNKLVDAKIEEIAKKLSIVEMSEC